MQYVITMPSSVHDRYFLIKDARPSMIVRITTDFEEAAVFSTISEAIQAANEAGPGISNNLELREVEPMTLREPL